MLRTTDEPSTQLAEYNGCSLLCRVARRLDRFVSAGHYYLLQYKYYHQNLILIWLLSNIMRLKAIWLYASGCS